MLAPLCEQRESPGVGAVGGLGELEGRVAGGSGVDAPGDNFGCGTQGAGLVSQLLRAFQIVEMQQVVPGTLLAQPLPPHLPQAAGQQAYALVHLLNPKTPDLHVKAPGLGFGVFEGLEPGGLDGEPEGEPPGDPDGEPVEGGFERSREGTHGGIVVSQDLE